MATKSSKSSKVSVRRADLEEAAVDTAIVAVEVGAEGEANVVEGVETLEASAAVARGAAVALASGASDLTRAEDTLIVADRLATLSEVVSMAGALDMEQGGEIARTLSALYVYCMRCIIEARADNTAMLDEAERHITRITDAWKKATDELRTQAATGAAAEAVA